ncbi:hypothetical protein JCM11641_005202 [Rhodosporidiobolus odoratus]
MATSLVSSLRTALRARPAPVPTLLRPYSTPSAPSPPSSDSTPSPSSPQSAGQADLNSLLDEINSTKLPPRSTPPRVQSATQAYPGARRGTATANAYNFLNTSTPSYPTTSFSPTTVKPTTPDQLWRGQPPVAYSLPVTTTSARSFPVLHRDVAQAYRKLNRTLQENNVRRELKRQERFESPSNKRVRLNSERHRRRFKVAVGKAVALAMRMKDL